MPRLTTRPMTQDEFDHWQSALAHEYAEDQVAAGNWPREDALDRALAQNAQLLPQGIDTPRTFLVLAIGEDGQAVGRAWVSLDHPRGALDTAFLYDIEIDEAHRGEGFGRLLLADIERLVAAEGIGALELNVFGNNPTAIALYQSSGYSVVTQQMRKPLR
ncbi:GNAT family N-acetyltransferase [Mycetocola manganoxydans]|uniref:GNAT family N-acetyltransferase n=1 Tax=Mycetocola manganoxydans TaxID=699879 RepID=A0A3L6ZY04_9MICO|nr:GNAT family N-acetyltransferase [Mycetocola manganoxydans]RLP72598.1 GNAT family N-acetyltransferase [Mycetocola manganoxydans]GHD40914.1 hypothetical protein GCM10008097_05530 [Mycetocola manganoxydans]